MINNKFSRASKEKTNFPFHAPKEENEIEEEDETVNEAKE